MTSEVFPPQSVITLRKTQVTLHTSNHRQRHSRTRSIRGPPQTTEADGQRDERITRSPSRTPSDDDRTRHCTRAPATAPVHSPFMTKHIAHQERFDFLSSLPVVLLGLVADGLPLRDTARLLRATCRSLRAHAVPSVLPPRRFTDAECSDLVDGARTLPLHLEVDPGDGASLRRLETLVGSPLLAAVSVLRVSIAFAREHGLQGLVIAPATRAVAEIARGCSNLASFEFSFQGCTTFSSEYDAADALFETVRTSCPRLRRAAFSEQHNRPICVCGRNVGSMMSFAKQCPQLRHFAADRGTWRQGDRASEWCTHLAECAHLRTCNPRILPWAIRGDISRADLFERVSATLSALVHLDDRSVVDLVRFLCGSVRTTAELAMVRRAWPRLLPGMLYHLSAGPTSDPFHTLTPAERSHVRVIVIMPGVIDVESEDALFERVGQCAGFRKLELWAGISSTLVARLGPLLVKLVEELHIRCFSFTDVNSLLEVIRAASGSRTIRCLRVGDASLLSSAPGVDDVTSFGRQLEVHLGSTLERVCVHPHTSAGVADSVLERLREALPRTIQVVVGDW